MIKDLLQEETNSYIINQDDITYSLSILKPNLLVENNVSSIDIGDCGTKLKEHYDLSQDSQLLVFKVDYYLNDSLIPVVGYEVYNPITYEKLNLSICENNYIHIDAPASIDESFIDKYKPDSKFYTDDCQPYTTDDGTDIILSDRQKEYLENNLSICENNCTFISYNETTKKSTCNCKVKTSQIIISDISDRTGIFLPIFHQHILLQILIFHN